MVKRIGLWNPYLDTIGGGEKHMVQLCDFFIRHGYELTIFWDKNIQKQIEQKLSVKLPPSTIWAPSLKSASKIQRYNLLKNIDVLLYATDGSYFFSSSKYTICFCMVPEAKLYNLSIIDKIKTIGWIFVSNSKFTQKNLYKYGIQSEVIYPYIDIPKKINQNTCSGTSLTFLSVGRFFRQLHSKRHDVAVAWFVNFIEQYPEYKNSRLVLAGGLKKEDNQYFESLRKLATQYPNIEFRPNIPSHELEKLYFCADFYLHFAGWQVNETSHPERTEHLGITPLEAMIRNCIPLCYKSGGIREIIKDGENGFTFLQLSELSQKIITISKDVANQQVVRENARMTVTTTFSRGYFDEKMSNVFRKFV
jgi:glycosyltransferase involved in cell wall biosynthesis